jgi:hypothetical protein
MRATTPAGKRSASLTWRAWLRQVPGLAGDPDYAGHRDARITRRYGARRDHVLVNDRDLYVSRRSFAVSTTDLYGIPGDYFSGVDHGFYGVVGRIVMLASLVELQLFHLVCTLDAKPRAQERYAGKPARQMIDRCRELLADERDPYDAGTALLDRVESAVDRRNEVVHSSWPHPTLHRAYGWRPAPLRLRSDDGLSIAEVETDEGKLRDLIGELVQLVAELPAFRQRIEDERWRHSAGVS